MMERTLRLAGGTAGGLLLLALSVPAGAIIGAVLGSAIMSAVRGSTVSNRIRETGLLLLGAASALQVDAQTLSALHGLLVPLTVALAALIGVQLLLAYTLHRTLGWDPATAILASAPGGVGEITAIADTSGARSATVVSIHVVRVVFVVLVALPVLTRVLA